ncbi:MAG: ABC transporter permease [Proteobacteria bacterium]|nr:MAG: ABC transporter permease [Pseudomonadota bacterium]
MTRQEWQALSYGEKRERFNEAFNQFFRSIGLGIVGFVTATGELVQFGVRSIKLALRVPYRWEEIFLHMEFVGNKSIVIIALSSLFTGLALSTQIYMGFKIVNMTSMVGPTVGLGVLRELGPVLTGLIVSARAGGAMAARLGTMRVTEQIDALEVMGVDPIQYLVSPRIIATVLVMPLLTAVFDFVAMLGCYVICVYLFDIDSASMIERTTEWLEPYHLWEGLFKGALFGLFFAVICTYRGYNTKGGAEGVGNSTNQGVVTSMVMIIVLDFFVTNLINVFYQLTARFT